MCSAAAAVVPRDALATALVFGHLGERLYKEIAAVRGVWCDAVAVAGELWGTDKGALSDQVSWELVDNTIPPVVERSVQFDQDRVLKIAKATAVDLARLVDGLPQLRRLTLEAADLCEASVAKLTELQGLVQLQLLCPENFNPERLGELARGLPCLEQLSMPTEQLNDSWMAAIGEMVSLTHLEFNGRTMTDNGARHLTKLTDLQSLVMIGYVVLTNEIHSVVAQLKALETLDVSFCHNLGEDFLHQAATLPNLREVSLRGWKQLTSNGISSLQQAKLKKFVASNLRVHPAQAFAAVGGLLELESLSLQFVTRYSLTDALVAHLADMPLIALHLENHSVEAGDALPSLGKLVKLETLNLASISDEVAGTIGGLPRLKCLCVVVDGRSDLGDAGVARLVTSNARLQELSVTLGSGADASAEHLSSLKHLTDLMLRFSDIGDRGLAAICQMSQLERLDIGMCEKVTTEGICRISSSLVHLEYLDIFGSFVNDEGFKSLHQLMKIKSLYASAVKGITSEAFDGIGGMVSLDLLDVSGCDIQAEALAHIAKLPHLRRLYLGAVPEACVELIVGLLDRGINVSYFPKI